MVGNFVAERGDKIKIHRVSRWDRGAQKFKGAGARFATVQKMDDEVFQDPRWVGFEFVIQQIAGGRTMKINAFTTLCLILGFASQSGARVDSAPSREDVIGPVSVAPMGQIVNQINPTRVLLQSAGQEPLVVYDENGADLGDLEAHAILEAEVAKADADRFYSRSGGLDFSAVLRTISKEVDGQTLIPAKLAYDSHLNEVEVKAGTRYWVSLPALTEAKTVAVVGFESLADDDMTYNVNRRLLVQSGASAEAIYAYMMADHGVAAAEIDLIAPSLPDDDEKARFVLGSPTCECKAGSCRSTSGYGPRRSRRTTNGRRMSSYHRGHDIGGGAGTKIIAAEKGCVTRVLTNARSGYGLTVYVDHGNGYTTQYSHMSKFHKRSGCLRKGELIGLMGSTGNSTGPHLHLGLLRRGGYINPRPFLSEATIKNASRKCP